MKEKMEHVESYRGERERERERQRETERQRDRERERQTDRQTDREIKERKLKGIRRSYCVGASNSIRMNYKS